MKKKKSFWRTFKKQWQLWLLVSLPVIYTLIFNYLPMVGLQIAFRDYRIRDGIFGSEWVGLEHFVKFFSNYRWMEIVRNTIKITLYRTIVGFPIPILLALMLHVNRHNMLKKVTMNASYIPHFFSVVVMVGILNQVFNPHSGLMRALQDVFGFGSIGDIRVNPDAFVPLYVWSGIWQEMGFDSIIYISALSSVSEELHEAARLDGASRFKRMIYVDLPAIMPTVSLLLILKFGGLLSVGFEKIYLMQNSLNESASEVISTYVYKYGLGRNELSYGTAVGLMNSIIGTVLLLSANWVAKKLRDDDEGGLI